MVISKHKQDTAVAIILAAAFFYLYAQFGLRLAQGIYFDYLNLAFDFDPPYFINYLVGQLPDRVNYKHPLSMIFRPVASLFLMMGFASKAAAVLVMAFFGGVTVALVYGFCRLASFGKPEAVAATLFFGASSTSLFTAIIVESYGWANLSIVLVWFIFMWGARASAANIKIRVSAAVLVAGVTITNVMHALVAEFFACWRTTNLQRAIGRSALFGIYAGLALFVVLAVLQPQELWNVVARPVQTVKEVYWLRTKGANSGLGDLLLTFLGYSFFSPAFAKVAISPDVVMLDFRTFTYGSLAQVAVFVWWGFALAGLVMGLKNKAVPYRLVVVPLLTVLVLNLLLHLDYQFRGSLYIYAAHLHFPVFALAMGAAPWVSVQDRRLRLGYVGVLLALAAAALVVNLQRASEFAPLFDTLTYPADSEAIRP
jgi:hypothetical protein